MREKHVSFEIDEEGNVKLEGHNFHGPECDQHLRDLARALGETSQTRRKPEFNIRQVNRNIQRGGR